MLSYWQVLMAQYLLGGVGYDDRDNNLLEGRAKRMIFYEGCFVSTTSFSPWKALLLVLGFIKTTKGTGGIYCRFYTHRRGKTLF